MGHFVINLNENANIGTNWVVCFVKGSNATCFNSFRLERIPNEIEGFKVDQNVKYFWSRSILFNNAWILLHLIGLLDV